MLPSPPVLRDLPTIPSLFVNRENCAKRLHFAAQWNERSRLFKLSLSCLGRSAFRCPAAVKTKVLRRFQSPKHYLQSSFATGGGGGTPFPFPIRWAEPLFLTAARWSQFVAHGRPAFLVSLLSKGISCGGSALFDCPSKLQVFPLRNRCSLRFNGSCWCKARVHRTQTLGSA